MPSHGSDAGGDAQPARIIIEGPGGVIVGEGPPGGGGPIRPRRADDRTTWNDLTRIHEVDELGDRDREVLAEMADVLRRHGVEDRFGVTLLHSHFDIADDEVLVERVDAEARQLTITSEPVEGFMTEELVPTAWRFVGQRVVPLQYCHRPKNSEFHMR